MMNTKEEQQLKRLYNKIQGVNNKPKKLRTEPSYGILLNKRALGYKGVLELRKQKQKEKNKTFRFSLKDIADLVQVIVKGAYSVEKTVSGYKEKTYAIKKQTSYLNEKTLLQFTTKNLPSFSKKDIFENELQKTSSQHKKNNSYRLNNIVEDY